VTAHLIKMKLTLEVALSAYPPSKQQKIDV
jgi:hypothetical protein